MNPLVTLRQMAQSDAPMLFDLESRPEVNRYQSYDAFDLAKAERYAVEAEESWASGDFPTWQEFILEADGTWAGRIGFEHAEERATVWFAVLPAFQGHGIARAALAQLIDRVRPAGLNEIWGYCDPENIPSARLMMAVGFEEQAREESGDRAFCLRLDSPF
jgi:RimJ/RimL family protein N-acetyltransferase